MSKPNFDLTNLAVQMVMPSNEILYDDKGMPSVMVRIPKFKISDVITGGSSETHPAFIVNGKEVDEIYISKYLNIVQDGRAYSLPGQDPGNNVNFDQAVQYCTAKGEGWHLMTNAEWAAVELWCLKNGFIPSGNNNYGRDGSESNYKAIPSTSKDSSGRIQRTATGTGPLSWYHDNSVSGIADLKGTVWEWSGGLRLVYGELQVLANNSAADLDNPQNATSTMWKAIDATSGALITPNGSGTTENSIKVDNVGGKIQYVTSIANTKGSFNCKFKEITCASNIADAAKEALKALGLLPTDTSADFGADCQCYVNNAEAERLVFRGGYWNNSANGLFSFDGADARSNVHSYIGWRSAFVKLPV
jgi:hypothetical protein